MAIRRSLQLSSSELRKYFVRNMGSNWVGFVPSTDFLRDFTEEAGEDCPTIRFPQAKRRARADGIFIPFVRAGAILMVDAC